MKDYKVERLTQTQNAGGYVLQTKIKWLDQNCDMTEAISNITSLWEDSAGVWSNWSHMLDAYDLLYNQLVDAGLKDELYAKVVLAVKNDIWNIISPDGVRTN